ADRRRPPGISRRGYARMSRRSRAWRRIPTGPRRTTPPTSPRSARLATASTRSCRSTPSNGLCGSRCAEPRPLASPYSALHDAGGLAHGVIRRGVTDVADVLIRLVIGTDRLRPPLWGAQVTAEVASQAGSGAGCVGHVLRSRHPIAVA